MTGVSEEQINLQITLKIQELLEASNCNVVLTRSDENGIYDADAKSKKSSDLHNRVDIVNSSNADCLVSIHLNKISQEQYYGWQSFYQKGNEKSINLAKAIQSSLNYSTRSR
ncbi:MAG: N-acetylmuramoyl-L-alanine amidase [Clostridia bacterium]|nr:N-acetylmuramoyl-L-alanine amidase [Clostridia bacterium]